MLKNYLQEYIHIGRDCKTKKMEERKDVTDLPPLLTRKEYVFFQYTKKNMAKVHSIDLNQAFP